MRRLLRMNGLGNKEGWMQGANFNGPYTGQIPQGKFMNLPCGDLAVIEI